jgi:hypothetical protein
LSSYKLAENLQQSSSRYVMLGYAQIGEQPANLFPAAPLGLLEEDAPGVALTTILQGLTRFLLDRLAQDWRSIPPHSLAFEQVALQPYVVMYLLIRLGPLYRRHNFDPMHELPK